ncbi:hypothetical protein KP509_20G031200 [Ceratopteris richardii]|uniref:1-acyl-sn-glycerol-3-phosphate acyltransferase n=1 Tax=Ceratopteris richardii TaxID=49495 RepID=A0A8T2SI07_CERRI|nr:hypothetical protein KP509_20G031200 [Ceratopteris richardii]
MGFTQPILRHGRNFSTYLQCSPVHYLRKGPPAHDDCHRPSPDNNECTSRAVASEQRQSSNAAKSESALSASAQDHDPSQTYRDDDSLWTVFTSIVKIVTCFSSMLVTTIIWAFILLILLPFPSARIKQSNIYGHVTGRMLMWILGNPTRIFGTENANLKAIYICNHASPLDIFLVMWLTPTGTVGIAKKEIIWYPFFGQLYVLANHLRIDRSNSGSSILSLRKVAKSVVDRDLSLIVFPEGTRSATGRLLPFKKGFVHLAIQTRRPIVPIVLTGTHLGWQKNSLRVRPAPLTVTFLPPIKTDDWTSDNVEKYVNMVHSLYTEHLPPSQKPLESVTTNAQS